MKKLKEQQEIVQKVQLWQARLDKLTISERQFCLKHSLPLAGFNRMKNLKGIPTLENVKKVEKALKREGV